MAFEGTGLSMWELDTGANKHNWADKARASYLILDVQMKRVVQSFLRVVASDK